jgi:hypothetical protein
MTYPKSEIDKIGYELHQMAASYAEKAEQLASDPYFREAVVKVSVSSFVWALFHKFDEFERSSLLSELITQTEAVRRALEPNEK